MALAQDLMGLGESSLAAARIAGGGTGPVTMAAATGGAAGATPVGGTQFVTYVNTGSGGILLPPNGGLTGPLIYDNFIIHNGMGSTLTIYPPTGVTVNIGGSNFVQATPITVTTLRTLSLWTGPTSTQWFGLTN